MDLRERKWSGVDRIDLVQDTEQLKTLVNTTMKRRVP
jgi:hypothetical protein